MKCEMCGSNERKWIPPWNTDLRVCQKCGYTFRKQER